MTAEGGPHEPGLPTFPSRRFVQAGGLTLAHEGLLEYELVDIDGEGAHTLALTLLARHPLSVTRPDGVAAPSRRARARVAGIAGAGRHELRYVVAVGDVDPYAVVDDAFVPLLVARARGGGAGPATGSALNVEGAQVSAVRRVDGELEVRVFNPTDATTCVQIAGRSGRLVDLRGRTVGPFDDTFDLPPQRIATIRLTG